MPMQFELSCMSGRPLSSYQIVLLRITNNRSKTTFFKFAIYDRFSSFNVKRFCRPLYRRVLLRWQKTRGKNH